MTLVPGGHAAFLLVALATHALVGYTIGAVALDRPAAGLVGGVVADVDLLVPAAVGAPFVHRGLTHGLFALVIATAISLRLSRHAGAAVALGYCSQLLIDATTPMGIPLFSPLTEAYFGLDIGVGGHSPPATVAFWIVCLGVLWYARQ